MKTHKPRKGKAAEKEAEKEAREKEKLCDRIVTGLSALMPRIEDTKKKSKAMQCVVKHFELAKKEIKTPSTQGLPVTFEEVQEHAKTVEKELR